MAAASLALALFILGAVVGPEKTLAAVQRLIGYIPGIGFVEEPLQAWSVLVEPVAAERDGVTLTVEKLLAGADVTRLYLRVDGLSQDKSLYEPAWGEGDQPILVVPNPELNVAGESFVSTGWFSGAGDYLWAEYEFPPLPAGTEQVTLHLPRIPGLAAGVAPEDWSIELHLREAALGDGLVATTAEPRASEPASGARLVIENVAATAEGTALRVRLVSETEGRSPAVNWRAETGGQPVDLEVFGLSLTDDQGQPYPLGYEEILRMTGDSSSVLLAPPLDPARTYTLRLEGANFEYGFNGEQAPAFRLAVPDGAALGDTWALDQTYEVAGFSFHLIEAALRPGYSEGVILALTMEPVEGITGIGLNCVDLDVCSASGFTLSGAGEPLQTEIFFDEVPAGTLLLHAQTIHETAAGPWAVEFQLDEGELDAD